MRNLLALAAVALIVYTIFDVLRSDEAERFGVHKLIWLAFIVVLPVVGSIAWLVMRQMARSSRTAGPAGSPRTMAAPAPDDDPEFLWRLEQQRRRADRERSGEHPDEPRPEA
ncbi:PLD nuclease N-terminal domain-containing protein [Cellulomonas timonensis]|uniref:PLD nuclease N-terminal domain-containing protein n=1 Tax=Cellulomonas timonensis TaxID=1689271 RepID=UPI0008329D5C|nr:PLD nuclease N-terminal domain-containing protein [Cellulomonas timonensis]